MRKQARSKKAYQDGVSREAMAAALLRMKFYRILGTRLKTPFGEVDILAEKNGALVIVEVKARDSENAAAGAISAQQKERLLRAGEYLSARFQNRAGQGWNTIRMDAFLFMPRRLPRHIKNAFGPR